MMPKLVPACQTPATDGTVFVTNSEKVADARAMVEEDLLIRHPIDCPICDKAGECYLQDYHFEHGRSERRADLKPFTSRRRPMGDTVTLFVDRCVMCSRCVRFTREITGTAELMVVNRGAHEEIDVFPGYPLANKMSGNVVDLCPVGALGDTDFLVLPACLVHEAASRRLCRLLDRVARFTSRRIRIGSIGSSRARTRTSTNGGCATRDAMDSSTCIVTDRLTEVTHRREDEAQTLEWDQAYRRLRP